MVAVFIGGWYQNAAVVKSINEIIFKKVLLN